MRSIGRHLTTSRSIFANGTRCYSSRQESQGSSKSGRVESEFAASLESLVGNLDTPLASRPATQSSTAKPTDTPPSSVPTDRFVEKHDGIASFGSQANTPKPMSSVKLFRGGAFAEIASKSPPEFFDDEKKVTPRRISGRFGLSRKRQAVPGASTAGSPRTSPRTQTSSGNQVRSSLNPRTPSSPTYRKPQNSVQQFGKKSGKQVTTDDPRGGRRKRETKTDDMEYEVRGDWKLYVGYMIHSEHPRVITYAHLRELCTCEKCIHPTTRQRLQTPGEVFDNLTSQGWLRKIPDTDMLSIEGDKLSINWDGKGAHRHEIDAKSVLRQIKSITQQEFLFLDTMKRRVWDLDTLDRKLPKLTIDYSTLRHKDGHFDSHTMYRLLYNLQVYGIVKLKGVPTEMTDNETCELRSIAQAIGPIKNTFYGETWDVRNQPDSKNVAYTDLNLGLHMDLLYFTDPPRFQLLHCLRNRVEGGNSYFVDAFKVAEDLEQSHPAETVSLKNNKLLFEYKNDGHHMSQRRAVLSSERHATDRDVAWSPPFQGVRPSFPQYQETAPTGARSALTPSSYALQSLRRETAWLKAMRLWEERLDDEKYRYEFKMEEGDLVLFDNRRVLHARRAFRDWTPKERQEQHLPDPIKGEPSRWLKGCYIDGDVVWDRLSVMYNERAANDSKRILLERISRATGMHS